MARPAALEAPREGLLPRAAAWARTLRLGEVALMTGFPAAAALYGLAPGELPRPALAWALGGLLLLALAIYTFNCVAGAAGDRHDPKFRSNALHSGELSPNALLLLALGSFVAALAVLAAGASSLVIPAGLLAILWVAYSLPRGLKGVPLAGAAVHLLSGAVLFLGPYALHRAPDARGGWLAAAFALALASGHANHELVDRESDRAAGLRTTAVVLGPRRAHLLGLAWALLAYAVLGCGLALGALPAGEALPFLAAAPVHLTVGARALAAGPDAAAARRYRAAYRILFGAAVALSLGAHLTGLAR